MYKNHSLDIMALNSQILFESISRWRSSMNALIKQNKLNGKENLKTENEKRGRGRSDQNLCTKVYIIRVNPPVHKKMLLQHQLDKREKYLI